MLAEVALRAAGQVPSQRNPLSGFHVSHPRLGWLGAPDYAARFRRPEFDVLIRNDERGFRQQEHPTAPPGTAPTVAFLGDSFTWGWGVPQGAVFTDRLRERMGGSFRVLNFGVNAYGTAQVLGLLEEVVLAERPDVVVYCFYENDLEDNMAPKGGRRPYYDLVDGVAIQRNVPVRRPLYGAARSFFRHSVALSWLRFGANLLGNELEDMRDGVGRREVRAGPDDTLTRARWEVFRQLLERMRDACARAPGSPRLLVIYVPIAGHIRARLRGEDPARPGWDRLRDTCEDLGVPLLDPTSALLAASRSLDPAGRVPGGTTLYFAQDGHWTAEGHRVVAEFAADALNGEPR